MAKSNYYAYAATISWCSLLVSLYGVTVTIDNSKTIVDNTRY